VKLKPTKVIKRLVEAYEVAKKQADCRAMADIAIQIENVKRRSEE